MYFQPPPGWFSDQKVDQEIAEEPPNSYLYVLYFLAGLENRCGIAGEIFEKIEKACQEPAAPAVVKAGFALLQLNLPVFGGSCNISLNKIIFDSVSIHFRERLPAPNGNTEIHIAN